MEESPLNNVDMRSALDADAASLTTREKTAVILLASYIIYILIQLTGWGKSFYKMLRFIHGKHRRRIGRGVWLVEHDADYGPFSWMNCIVISTREQGFGRRASVRHELSHIQLLHHMDLILLMACVIINPTCWIVMKEIKIVHEYEADDEVINHYRIVSRDYQRLLIMRTVGAEAYALASSFNLNIKKRIIMMKKEQSHWWRMMWIAVTIPLIGLTLMAFSKPKEALKEAVDNSVRIIEQPLAKVVKADKARKESIEEVAEPTKTVAEEVPQPQAPDVKPGDRLTGNVRAQDGKRLVGASIVIEDENHRITAATITDMNGNFSLTVSNPKHKLRISHVGYKMKTLDINTNTFDVTMEPNNMKFNEIEVVGHVDDINVGSAAEKKQTVSDINDNTFELMEKAPVFPGGQEGIFNYLSRHLKYPSAARDMRVEGVVVVQFTVDKNGLVRLPQVVDVTSATTPEGDDARYYNDALEALKEEAVYVVRNMPRWEPAQQNGVRTETTLTLPISFKLK